MEREYKDKVAVVIPLYNSEKFMEKTINSVLSQTYKNLEIILINDCSKDGTEKVAKQLIKQHPNIKYTCLKVNSGAAVARNKGLEITDARYIAFLDSDDTWESNKVKKQLGFMKNNGYSFTFSANDIVDENGNQICPKIKIKETVKYKDLLRKTMITTSTVMLDRKLFGDLSMPLRRTGQDYAFWLLLLRVTDAHGINEVIVHGCRRKNSLSKNKFQNIKDVWEVQTKYEKINVIAASMNVLNYCIYALRKRYSV